MKNGHGKIQMVRKSANTEILEHKGVIVHPVSQISTPIQRCKNCHWWGRYIEGVCDRIDIDENTVAPNEASMQVDVADDSGLFVKLVTGPEFGCTLFTNKAEDCAKS